MTIKRRNYGTGHGYKINGRKAPGVTTILRQEPKPALINWASRVTAEYAVNYWAELDAMLPADRLEALRGAANEHRDSRGLRGTRVHRHAERLVRGGVPSASVPEDVANHVEAYRQWLARWRPDPFAVELVIAHRGRPRYCGTADLVAYLAGEVWLLELKTSESGVYRSSALQACAYTRAQTYTLADDPEGVEHPLAELGIQRAGAVHIRADGCDLRPLDTGDDVWAYFCRLAWIHEHDEASKTWVGEILEPPDEAGMALYGSELAATP